MLNRASPGLETRIASMVISAVFSLVYLAIEFNARAYQSFGRRLTLCLGTAHLLLAASGLLEVALDPGDDPACYWSAYLRLINVLLTIFYTVLMSLNIHNVVRRGTDLSALEGKLHTSVWLAAVAIASIPHVDQSFGPAGIQCWVPNKPGINQVWRLLTFYLPMWTTVVAISILFTRTMRTVYAAQARVQQFRKARNHTQLTKEESALKFTVKRLIGFPGIFILCWTVPSIHRIYDVVTAGAPVPNWILIVHGMLIYAPGYLNVLWFYRRTVINASRRVWRGSQSRTSSHLYNRPSTAQGSAVSSSL